MTHQPAIIGIVKELQGEANIILSHGCNCDKRCRTCTNLVEPFPAIAEALLILHETVENYAKGGPVIETHDGSGSVIREDLAIPARDALARLSQIQV